MSWLLPPGNLEKGRWWYLVMSCCLWLQTMTAPKASDTLAMFLWLPEGSYGRIGQLPRTTQESILQKGGRWLSELCADCPTQGPLMELPQFPGVTTLLLTLATIPWLLALNTWGNPALPNFRHKHCPDNCV